MSEKKGKEDNANASRLSASFFATYVSLVACVYSYMGPLERFPLARVSKLVNQALQSAAAWNGWKSLTLGSTMTVQQMRRIVNKPFAVSQIEHFSCSKLNSHAHLDSFLEPLQTASRLSQLSLYGFGVDKFLPLEQLHTVNLDHCVLMLASLLSLPNLQELTFKDSTAYVTKELKIACPQMRKLTVYQYQSAPTTGTELSPALRFFLRSSVDKTVFPKLEIFNFRYRRFNGHIHTPWFYIHGSDQTWAGESLLPLQASLPVKLSRWNVYISPGCVNSLHCVSLMKTIAEKTKKAIACLEPESPRKVFWCSLECFFG